MHRDLNVRTKKQELKKRVKDYCIENKFNPMLTCTKLQKVVSLFNCADCPRKNLCVQHQEDIERYPLFILKYYFNFIYQLKRKGGGGMKDSYLVKKKDGTYEVMFGPVSKFDFNLISEIYELKEEHEIVIKLLNTSTAKDFDLPKWVATNAFHEGNLLKTLKEEEEFNSYVTDNFKAGQSVFKLGQKKKPVISLQLKKRESKKKILQPKRKPTMHNKLGNKITTPPLLCKYCGRDNFKSEKGKKRHEFNCKKNNSK